VLGRAERGDPDQRPRPVFRPATGEGYVAPLTADYADAIQKQHDVIPMLFETFGGFSPEAVKLLGLLRDEVSNKLSAAQYEQTTWSARSWMAFQCQKISVALHKAAAMEIALELGLAAARVGGGED